MFYYEEQLLRPVKSDSKLKGIASAIKKELFIVIKKGLWLLQPDMTTLFNAITKHEDCISLSV